MPTSTINLIKGDSIGVETDYRDSLPVNMTAILRPMFGAAGYMIQQPGLTQHATGEGIDRGGVWNERQQNHYRISGEKFISIDASGNKTVLGDVPGVDVASLPYSFNTQAIIADERMWLYDAANGFREVTDPDLGNPIDGEWVDGVYFMTDGQRLFHTQVANEASIAPLDFATAEFMPDPSNGIAKTPDNKVAVFGRYSTEYFVNRAGTNFLFERVPTRAVKAGIVGTHAKCELGGSFFILGGRKEECVSVHRLGVGSVEKVATREVDKVIGKYTETQLAEAVLESRVEDGYSHILVHLPDETLLFNVTVAAAAGISQAWTVLRSGVDPENRYRAKFGVFDARVGRWIYGDSNDATIGILDETVATHYGQIAEWELFTPFMYLDSQSIDQLEIETLPGHTSSDDATVFVSLTYDGVTHGKEWVERYGARNDYGKRFIIYRMGHVRNWVAIKLRGATRSRMAFCRGKIDHG